jgi:hypothetical protein
MVGSQGRRGWGGKHGGTDGAEAIRSYAVTSIWRAATNRTKVGSSRGFTMKTTLPALLVGIAVTLAGGMLAVAADDDSADGTWTLNLAKSKFGSSPAPKSEMRTYLHLGQDVTLRVNGIAADGSTVSWQTKYRYGGKDYPVTGSTVFDTLAVKRVSTNTTSYEAKKAGKVVLTGARTISADGKVLTLSIKGADAKGAPFNVVAVYDKH